MSSFINYLFLFWFSEQFSADTRDESWDRIRVVLSQPYRKDVQFGLSVLRILAADNEMSSKVITASVTLVLNW